MFAFVTKARALKTLKEILFLSFKNTRDPSRAVVFIYFPENVIRLYYVTK